MLTHAAEGFVPPGSGSCCRPNDELALTDFQFDRSLESALFQDRLWNANAARIADTDNGCLHAFGSVR